MVHLGLKNQINTWIVTYSLDLTLAQPSPSCSKNLCYLRKKKYMQSPRNICQDQQHRNKNEWDQPEEVYLLKLFLFSGQWNPEHEATLRADSQVMACIFFFSIPARSFIIIFSLFVFLHLQNADRLNMTKINVFVASLHLSKSGQFGHFRFMKWWCLCTLTPTLGKTTHLGTSGRILECYHKHYCSIWSTSDL